MFLLVALNVVIRVVTSVHMIIPDCDETFNYWEPLNLLLRGFGKETWEYSPEFSIRSYSYLLPYYLIGYPFQRVVEALDLPSYYTFYFVRVILALFTSYGEIKLFTALKRHFNKQTAVTYLVFSTFSTGLAHASSELLPSAFAMQTLTLSLSSQLDNKLVKSLSWLLVGGLMGWPFSLALSAGYGISLLFNKNLISIFLKTLVNLVALVLVIVSTDFLFYKKLDFIPLNIVLYNVFGGEGEGPEIFGTEPFSYYILNLALNFNVVAVAGYVGVIFYSNWKINVPLLIWSTIFFSQPHKEERFLYPIYPLILANGSIAINKVIDLFPRDALKKLLLVLTYGLFITISISRTFNLVENYSAPLTVSKYLNNQDQGNKNVCIGREWYHFPTSFFLPDGYRLKFVKSGFDGLLPGDFLEGENILLATSNIPEDMNNKNYFSESKVIPFEQCDYYIDNSGKTNGIEPDVIHNANWSTVHCEKLINPDGDHGIGRLVYIPEFARNMIPYNVEYMQFCLLKRDHSNI